MRSFILTGNDTISIRALAKRLDAAGAHTLAYENAYEPAKTQRIANIFVRPGGGWRFVVTGQRRSDDGSRLTVTYTVSR